MYEQYRSPEELATPEQAGELLDWLKSTLLNTPTQTAFTVSYQLHELPGVVERHMPDPGPNCLLQRTDLFAVLEEGSRTESLIATFSFDRLENMADDKIIGTHVRYEVRDDGGVLGIERRFDTQEHGLLKIREFEDRFTDDPEAAIDMIFEEIRQGEESLQEEKRYGLTTVTYREAEEILALCHNFAP
jgi:hypothetical protein